MTAIDFEEKRKEVLAKFNADFIQKYLYNDPVFYKVYNALVSGVDPYYIIGLLIESRKEIVDKIEELVINMPPRQIVMTKEEYDKFKTH